MLPELDTDEIHAKLQGGFEWTIPILIKECEVQAAYHRRYEHNIMSALARLKAENGDQRSIERDRRIIADQRQLAEHYERLKAIIESARR